MGCARAYPGTPVGYVTGVDAATVRRWLEGSAAALHEQRDYLTQLDAAIGDADHGTNMDRGFSSVVAKLAELDHAVQGRLQSGSELLAVELLHVAERATGPPQGSAPQRAARAADLGDERAAGGRQRLAGGRRWIGPVQLREHSREAAIHVRPVIGVADRGVELRQVVALVVQRGRRRLEPPGHGRRIHAV